jgi:hypothetical protein
MLTMLITGNLSAFHDRMKLYTRKPVNFLDKKMCLLVVDKSNDYLMIKMKYILSYYRSIIFRTHVEN